MKSHQPTIETIAKCTNKYPGQLLAKALAQEVDIPCRDAVTMCERNSIDPFQICGDGPLKQLASTDTSDITPLRREIQAHAIDIDAQLSIIRGVILRLDAIESKLNHRNP